MNLNKVGWNEIELDQMSWDDVKWNRMVLD